MLGHVKWRWSRQRESRVGYSKLGSSRDTTVCSARRRGCNRRFLAESVIGSAPNLHLILNETVSFLAPFVERSLQ